MSRSTPAPIQARVPRDLAAALEAEVNRTGASASEIIRRALLAYPPIAAQLALPDRPERRTALCGYCGGAVAATPTMRGLRLIRDNKAPFCPRCDRELGPEAVIVEPNL